MQSRQDQVNMVIAVLKSIGCDPENRLVEDGKVGPMCREAVVRFLGFAENGNLKPHEINALGYVLVASEFGDARLKPKGKVGPGFKSALNRFLATGRQAIMF